MKFCVLATLKVGTRARNDALRKAILDNIAVRATWGPTRVEKSMPDTERAKDSKPQTTCEVRFDHRSDCDELFKLIKDRMEKLPVISGSVSKHQCYHDEDNRPCRIGEEYRKGA